MADGDSEEKSKEIGAAIVSFTNAEQAVTDLAETISRAKNALTAAEGSLENASAAIREQLDLNLALTQEMQTAITELKALNPSRLLSRIGEMEAATEAALSEVGTATGGRVDLNTARIGEMEAATEAALSEASAVIGGHFDLNTARIHEMQAATETALREASAASREQTDLNRALIQSSSDVQREMSTSVARSLRYVQMSMIFVIILIAGFGLAGLLQ